MVFHACISFTKFFFPQAILVESNLYFFIGGVLSDSVESDSLQPHGL